MSHGGHRLPEKLTELIEDADRRGVSQRQVAEMAGVRRTDLNKWKNGGREPKLDAVLALAGHFGVSVGWLIGADEPKWLKDPEEDVLRLEAARGALRDLEAALIGSAEDLAREWRDRLETADGPTTDAGEGPENDPDTVQ